MAFILVHVLPTSTTHPTTQHPPAFVQGASLSPVPFATAEHSVATTEPWSRRDGQIWGGKNSQASQLSLYPRNSLKTLDHAYVAVASRFQALQSRPESGVTIASVSDSGRPRVDHTQQLRAWELSNGTIEFRQVRW